MISCWRTEKLGSIICMVYCKLIMLGSANDAAEFADEFDAAA